jgi:hypothetical protein
MAVGGVGGELVSAVDSLIYRMKYGDFRRIRGSQGELLLEIQNRSGQLEMSFLRPQAGN